MIIHSQDLRQIVFDGLGHESPTFVLTNDFPERLSARKVIETYARRNHVEHSLGEKITFFHLDCLSSEVRLNVDFDLTLTVVAAMLYQRLADKLKGFNHATPQTIFRRFINTHGTIEIANNEITVCFEVTVHVVQSAITSQEPRFAGSDTAISEVVSPCHRRKHLFFRGLTP